MPAMGTPLREPRSRVVAYISDDDRISGSMDMGMPMSAAMSGFQDRVSRSMSRVREALVGSVMWMPPSTPPVMFHSNQVSMLPNNRSPFSARSRAPSTLSRIHLILGPEKYVASGSPVLSR